MNEGTTKKELEKDGALKKIRDLIKSEKTVNIEHSSGRTQKGKVVELLQTGLIVRVTFLNQTKTETYSKYVNSEDFLTWQKRKT